MYIRVMTKVLGRQTVPATSSRVGLTPQNLRRFEQRFNCPVVAMHSAMPIDRLLA